MTLRSSDEIARVIDYALLHPAMLEYDLKSGIDLAHEFNIWAVCVKPCENCITAT